jgi:dephospho-CoA kinase
MMLQSRDKPDRSPGHKPIVGLIGGMGSGKTLLARELARRGGCIIAGDPLGHEALERPEIAQKLIDQLGPEIRESKGGISRSKLAALVFADPNKRRVLEAAVHPYIEKRFGELLRQAAADDACRFIVLDAAILLEAGWRKFVDAVVYVHAPRPVRLGRLWEERGWSEAEVQARERAQLPLAEKIAAADFIVDNLGPAEDISRQAEDLLAELGVPAGSVLVES